MLPFSLLSLPSLLSLLHLCTRISVCADSSCPDREALIYSTESCQSVRLNWCWKSQEPHSRVSKRKWIKADLARKINTTLCNWRKREANPKCSCACLLLSGECWVPQKWTRLGAGWSSWRHLTAHSSSLKISDSRAGRLDCPHQQMYSVSCTQLTLTHSVFSSIWDNVLASKWKYQMFIMILSSLQAWSIRRSHPPSSIPHHPEISVDGIF